MRHTCSICQQCYERQRPTEYFPETFREGTCCGCGDDSFVARVTKAEAEEQAEYLFGAPEDRPHYAPAVVNPDGSPTAYTLSMFGR